MRNSFQTLLIEDSPEDRITVSRTIKKINENSLILELQYKEAFNLKEGLECLKDNSIDVLLLDLSLPDAEGMGAIEKLKEFYPNLPIIILTGNEDERNSIKAIQAGVQDYLIKKEISPHNLSRSIGYAIERSKTAKELEELRIQQAHSLKMATLGEVAGNLAHEINNPLTIILGFSERILKKLSTPETEKEQKIKSHVEKIHSMSERVAKIVKNLKSYSRNDESDPLQVVSVEDIINDTLELCSEKFKHENIPILKSEIPASGILCKDIQISQVLLNLMNNSFDAIQELDDRWVKIHVETEDNFVLIKITDSGQILDDKIKKSIFSPFYTTKERGKGTGLGMSISQGIIKEHNGSLSLLDTENTCFQIALPMAKV